MNSQPEIVSLPFLKRFFDIAVSLVLIFIFSPVLLFFLIAIFIEHILRGHVFSPLFYKEKRMSQGKQFQLIKYNIFNPKLLQQLKSSNTFIHTKTLEHQKNGLIVVGKFLKQIYFDELPQLFNVLKGDISLVGPRPANLEIYNERMAQGDFSKSIVKAGITGAFQAQKGNYKDTDKVLDLEYSNYIKNNPGWKVVVKDISIIFKTIWVVIKAKGI